MVTSILLVRTSAIGDVIQSFPVLEYLLRKFPNAKIDWVVEKGIAPLLNQMQIVGLTERPPLDRVLTLNTKLWAKAPLQAGQEVKHFYQKLREVEYDLLFDLQGNTKSAFVTAMANAQEKIGFGWHSAREKTNLLATSKRFELSPTVNIRQKYLGLVQSYFEDTSPFASTGVSFQLLPKEQARLDQLMQDLKESSPQLMVSVGSKWQNKRLKEETLACFLRKISEKIDPTYLFIYSSPEERALAEELSAAFPDRSLAVGELSLPLWQALMWKVDGVIAVDSAALHLAATTHTPTFSIFGPTDAALFKPSEERHHAHQGTCPYGRTFVKQCPILRTCPTGACIREINIDDLMQAFEKWYSQSILNYSI